MSILFKKCMFKLWDVTHHIGDESRKNPKYFEIFEELEKVLRLAEKLELIITQEEKEE